MNSELTSRFRIPNTLNALNPPWKACLLPHHPSPAFTSSNLNSSNNDVYVLNPVVEMLEIYFRDQNHELLDITISDVLGKVINTLKVSGESNMKIPFQSQTSGIYFV